jgi:hypothetical protein
LTSNLKERPLSRDERLDPKWIDFFRGSKYWEKYTKPLRDERPTGQKED